MAKENSETAKREMVKMCNNMFVFAPEVVINEMFENELIFTNCQRRYLTNQQLQNTKVGKYLKMLYKKEYVPSLVDILNCTKEKLRQASIS